METARPADLRSHHLSGRCPVHQLGNGQPEQRLAVRSGRQFCIGRQCQRHRCVQYRWQQYADVNPGQHHAIHRRPARNLEQRWRIDLSSGNTRTNDTLTVQGNYAGNGGQLLLQSVVGDDNSPSDKLVVNNGTLTGSTSDHRHQSGRNRRVDAAERYSVGAGSRHGYQHPRCICAQRSGIWQVPSITTCSRVALPQAAKTVGICALPLWPPRPSPSQTRIRPCHRFVVPVVATPVAALAPAGSPPLPVLPAAVPGASPIPLYRPEVPDLVGTAARCRATDPECTRHFP